MVNEGDPSATTRALLCVLAALAKVVGNIKAMEATSRRLKPFPRWACVHIEANQALAKVVANIKAIEALSEVVQHPHRGD